ncbi:MAG: ATP-binding protein [Roseiflexaceae bacterium]
MTGNLQPRQLAEQLLEENLEDLYEHAPCGYISTFPDGVFAKINQTFLDWIGYQRNQILAGKRFQDLLTVGGRIFYETHYAPLLQMQGFVKEIAFDLLCHDGRHVPVLINSVQKRDSSGTPLLNRTTIFDATNRREYERELLLARKVAEQATERIGRLQAVSVALAEALTPGQVAEVIVHQGVAALQAQAGLVALVSNDGTSLELVEAVNYAPEVLANWQHFLLDTPMPLTDAVRSGEPILLESPETLAARYPNFATISASIGSKSVAAIPLSANGRPMGVLGLSFAAFRSFSSDDHTFLLTLARQCALALERARLYEAERVARAQAQEAIHVRDTFLSIASHELKNPLTSLLGNAQLLQRRSAHAGTQSARDQQTVAVIVDQAARLNKLLTALLDVSQLESSQLRIERLPLDLCELTQQVVADMQPTLSQHSLTASVPGLRLIIDGDELRLEQVLNNLLQNAIKYSPAGGLITAVVEQREQMACVAVTDQGIGIPQPALPRLFERFYRAAQVDTAGIGGLGIGLYVVKEIVTLHGGTITVTSTEGVGSIFTICLPLLLHPTGNAG